MNNQIFFFFYNLAHRSEAFDKVVIFTADTLPYLVVVLAGSFLLFYRKSWRELFLVFGSSGVAYVFSKILKILIHVDRPFIEFSNVQSLFFENGFAFPSTHAMFFATLAVSIFLLHKKVGVLFIFFAFLIGMARIIAGVHFPFDILGGFILGAGISFMIAYLVKNVYNADILCGKN
ncbi:MAG: phosphatase PAP2 family protein [Minisyncoccia bacterium]